MSKQENFKKVLGSYKLQARGTGGVDTGANDEGIWDISNADRLGFSETDLVQFLIEVSIKLLN